MLLHGLFIYMESRGAEPEENAASGGRATKGSVSERTRPESSQRLRRDSPRLHQRQAAAPKPHTSLCGVCFLLRLRLSVFCQGFSKLSSVEPLM